ncbi:MAG: formyltransferase family protein [Candidatus Pacearchaeota archaeon]|nr:formyltransferase family protein [Candidatus Pacearchaeota archaeon]
MALRELYHPESGRMKVAGLISGSGSNLRKIIEHGRAIESSKGRSPYQVVVIFSDNPASNAEKIGNEYGIPVVVRDLGAFYKERGKPKKDLTVRAEFDEGTVEALKPFNVNVAAYAGYMSIATPVLIDAFLGVNVHPADLSVMDGDKRKYIGDHAVRDAIVAGEKQLKATTHIIEQQVDCGRILMVSAPLDVNLPEGFDLNNKDQVNSVSDVHQNRLKEVGDWVIFPRTLEYLADGRYSQDEQGKLYFEDKPISQGLMLEAVV